MATLSLDSNIWYGINVGSVSVLGTSPFAGGASRGAVITNTTDTSRKNQRWQIYPVNSTTWTLRTQEGGPNAYLGALYSPGEETKGNTRPYMARGDVADAGVYWNIIPWGDGTWHLSNVANTTSYHLSTKGNSIMVMSPNISAPQNGQRIVFRNITAINDKQYSSVNLIGVTTATSTISTPTFSPSPSASSTSSSKIGPSTGTQAAIGASIGIVALIAFIILGLFFWRRRKQRQESSNSAQNVHHELNDMSAPPITKYAMYLDSAPQYEMPLNERPSELPGHPIER